MIESVSVAMPTYNAMPFVREAVHSILTQSYDALELLIVNQHSMDGTDEYLNALTDSRVRVIHRKQVGIGEALDISLREARYDWVARMDADDIALPRRLEKEVEFLERNRQYALVSCAFGYIGGSGRQLKATDVQPLRCPPDYDPTVDAMILDQGMLFRRAAVVAAGGYRDIIPGAGVEGFDLCLRLYEASYRMASVPDILMLNRILPGGNTAANFIKQRVGWKYARTCSAARRAGRQEPLAEEFLRQQWPQGWQRLASESQRQFRLAGASWGADRRFESVARLALSLMLRPSYAVSKFRLYFFNSRRSQANGLTEARQGVDGMDDPREDLTADRPSSNLARSASSVLNIFVPTPNVIISLSTASQMRPDQQLEQPPVEPGQHACDEGSIAEQVERALWIDTASSHARSVQDSVRIIVEVLERRLGGR